MRPGGNNIRKQEQLDPTTSTRVMRTDYTGVVDSTLTSGTAIAECNGRELETTQLIFRLCIKFDLKIARNTYNWQLVNADSLALCLYMYIDNSV